jgi:hypothetical protein
MSLMWKFERKGDVDHVMTNGRNKLFWCCQGRCGKSHVAQMKERRITYSIFIRISHKNEQ